MLSDNQQQVVELPSWLTEKEANFYECVQQLLWAIQNTQLENFTNEQRQTMNDYLQANEQEIKSFVLYCNQTQPDKRDRLLLKEVRGLVRFFYPDAHENN